MRVILKSERFSPHLVVGEGLVGQLVHRVAGVGDQLPQKISLWV